MNRFKTKKKGAKDDIAASTRPSLESESSFNLFRRGKKNQEPEQKPEVDLTTALPSEDDFRTSLLMSGLSARFSMLREQDDPNTKIGKASDDSVLFPKRQSRLAGLGFNGTDLGDIAEVQSIRAPQFMRADSIASTDSGGVMTRSRPTEGNVLFGGRQKVYKINAGTASSRNLADGMGGRTLYDNDLSLSAFQRWRQTEKEKEHDSQGIDGEDDDDKQASDEATFTMRSESPLPNGYNKKRETSSTTSSAPSVGRNSTAATSVVSQPTAFPKENHPQQSAAPSSSVNSTPALDRVTRTRRLYEQGLTQDLQEQQHSVLSRVDTLARRPGGALTPELRANSPSPTIPAFADRFAAYGGERRTVLSKGSAPNLRSISPPTTGSLNGMMDLNTRVSNTAEPRAVFSPPLSPPISDFGTGDQLNLHIQPQDIGKATAMNMFQKPLSPYDDTKYSERQRQLQQGRETPTNRFHEDANFSMPDRSLSAASSTRREYSDVKTTVVSPKLEETSQADSAQGTFFDETLESPILNDQFNKSPLSPQLRLERPSDQDHPAFRQSTVSTPLAIPPKTDEQQLPRSETSFLTVAPRAALFGDSPTLGPVGGLSGMVRQHLRTESDVSSIYAPQNDAPASANKQEEPAPVSKNTWEEQDWNLSQGHDDERSPPPKLEASILPPADVLSPQSQKSSSFVNSARSRDEEDEFANQLANARRRVREKLTSFVETDGSAISFSPPMQEDQAGDLPPPPSRSNPLGILRGRGSRGSLIDRGRDAAPKPIKEIGAEYEREARLQDEESAHPSLRAFRQARRELQKGKEQEAMSKRSPQPHNGQFVTSIMEKSMTDSHSEPPRTASTERLASGFRQPRQMNEQGVPQPPPRSHSRPTRDRSGSENSDGSSQSQSRPPAKFREHSAAREDESKPVKGLEHSSTRKLVFPGLPGTDVRRSPITPAMSSSRSGPRSAGHGQHLEGINTSLKPLSGRSGTDPLSAGPSPLSPRSGTSEILRAPFQSNGIGGSAPPTPSGSAPLRRPSIPTTQTAISGSTLTDSMKRVVNKKDISEPTFLMSTSRVPTKNLPHSATESRENRLRSGSESDYGSPPPLPPVNPRRRNSSRPRTVVNNFMGGRSEADNMAISVSTPHLPIAPSPVSPFSESPVEERSMPFSMRDEDGKAIRRKLRKASSDIKVDSRAGVAPKRISPPQVAVGPPAGRAVMMSSNTRGPAAHLPGGMF